MNGDEANLAIAILPFLALILAALSIAGLWYWWTATKEQAAGEEQQPQEPLPSPDEEVTSIGDQTVGQFFGGLVDSVRSVVSGAKPSPEEATVLPAESFAAAPPVRTVESVRPSTDTGVVEVLRLLRDLADGSLIVEIGGQRYYALSQITDPQTRRHFMGNASALAQFAQLSEVPPPPSVQPVTPPAPAYTPAPEPTPAPPGSPPSATRSRPTAEAQAEEDAPALQTMADEIEELLQYRLTLTPEFAQRSIHIRQGAGGEIRIEVDGEFYDGVGEVTDDDVREFIQSTIREWEVRQ